MSRLLILIFLLTACGGGPQYPEQEPGPPIPGLKLSGSWYSEQFGNTELIQSGNKVRGHYEDDRGPDHNGTIRGVLQGDLLRLDWIKPGNPIAAIQGMRGKAWLRVGPKGKFLKGRWGYDLDQNDGGIWVMEKSQF